MARIFPERRRGTAPFDTRPGRRHGSPASTVHRFAVSIVCGLGALLAMGVSSTLGNVHGPTVHQKVFAFAGASAFLVLAVLAVRTAVDTLAGAVAIRAGRSGGTAVRVVVSFVGYVVVVFVGLGLMDVPVEHLLIGGALTGVIVGIAAQQALGNVFAGLVLLLARPFVLDERVRVRAGALGGAFDGTVRGMNLADVTIETDDGLVNVPNSVILAAGVGPAPTPDPAGELAVVRAGPPPAPDERRAGQRQPAHPIARTLKGARSMARSRGNGDGGGRSRPGRGKATAGPARNARREPRPRHDRPI